MIEENERQHQRFLFQVLRSEREEREGKGDMEAAGFGGIFRTVLEHKFSEALEMFEELENKSTAASLSSSFFRCVLFAVVEGRR